MGASGLDDLREITRVRQIPGESPRRWFTSNEFDLYLWRDEFGEISSFQLYYDKSRGERALIWKRGAGTSHFGVDDGERRPYCYKGTPILVPDGRFDAKRVAERLADAGNQLPAEILSFVLARIRDHQECPDSGH